MRKNILLILLLLSNISFAQWKTTSPFGVTINDITFTDRYTGYAVFQAQGTGSCMTTLSLYKTIDEGNTWIKMNTATTNAVNAVHFVNQLTGWTAGASSEIRKTTDGGVSWIQQNFGVGSGYNDIWFNDQNNGFVIGNNGLLRKSVNGGSTWQTIASGVTTTLRKIYFYNNSLGFIACGNGQVLRTTNGGSNWSVITTGAVVLNDIFFTTAQTGFAVGAYSLYTTTDGGLSWNLSPLSSAVPLTRMFFASEMVGYIVADGDGILKTTDGGISWTLYQTLNGSNDSWRGIYFTDENTGYICGALGRISKTTNGGSDWKNMICGFGQELFTVAVPHKDTAYIGSYAGKIYKTKNGGISYFQQTREFLSQISKISFLNPRLGFAGSDSGRILKTSDGGEHWHLIPTYSYRAITDFSFVDYNHGFASASGGIVFKTIDNGEYWDSINTGISEDYRGVWFINKDTGFVISSSKIISTYDGGLTWNVYNSIYASDLSDIVFTNDSLGYCAGGFGKFLFTKNAGLTWDTCNAGTTNAEINEMWAANDSTLYFARYGSQAMTIDSCKNVSAIATACLANNWSMNSIALTNGGNYGYAVGGLGGVVHQKEIPEIIRVFTSSNSYCPGSTVFIEYDAHGFYNNGNVFTAQLSDASGSFDSPQTIGTYTTSHMIYQAGIITATLPSGLSGNHFRIRVVASNPVVISPENGYDIVIQSIITPSVNLVSNSIGGCIGEEITITAIPSGGGLNPEYQWLLNGNSINNPASIYYTDSLQDGDTIEVILQSNLSCASPATAQSAPFIAAISSPPALNLGPDSIVCEFSSIQFTAPPGYTYSWSPSTFLNDTSIANPLAFIESSIHYQLKITDDKGCSSKDSIAIIAMPLPPVFNLGNDTSVCSGSTIQFDAPGGFTCSWVPESGLSNPSLPNPLATIDSDITYQLTLSSAYNCKNSDTITLHALALPPAFSLGNDTAVCAGSEVQLTTPSGYTYDWNTTNGLNDSTLVNPLATISIAITYHLTISDSMGCSKSDSIHIMAYPLPPIPVIYSFLDGIATASGYTYTWFLNGVEINGANDSLLIPEENGDYTVEITNAFGCSSISLPFTVIIEGIQQLNSQQSILVYPNPVTDELNISANFPVSEKIHIRILDVTGKVIYSENKTWEKEIKEYKIDVSSLSKGLYICNLHTDSYSRNSKFIK